MKNLSYLIVAALCICSCGGKGYTIEGSIENAEEGNYVYMMNRVNRQFEKVDSALIRNGKFTFKGEQEKPVNRYVVYDDEEHTAYTDFFLENGHTKIAMLNSGNTVQGSPMNNQYQAFKDKYNANMQKQSDLLTAIGNPEATEEERTARTAELEKAELENVDIIREGISKSLDSELGPYLLSQYNYVLEFDEIESFLSGLSATAMEDEKMIKLKEKVEKGKITSAGQKFIDLEMKTPDGKPIKLSDYVGKSKLVLVDFWASWCPPCRKEMPALVQIYKEYKSKGLEIVGVSLDKDLEAWKKGIGQLNITWPQMSDLKYWESKSVDIYAIRSIPHLMLVDENGTIVARGLHGNELKDKISQLLK